MGLLILPQRHKRFRPADAMLDEDHPIAQGLTGCWELGHRGYGGAEDFSRYRKHGVPDVAGSFPVGISPIGPCIIKGNNWNNEIVIGEESAQWSAAASAEYFFRYVGSSITPMQRLYFTAGYHVNAFVNAGTFNVNRTDNSVWHNASYAYPAGWNHVAWTDPNDGSTALRIYLNGVQVATAGSTAAMNFSGKTFSYHHLQPEYPYGDLVYARGWNRALREDEVWELFQDPYCIFKPRRTLMLLADVGGGPPVVKRRLALLGVGR